MLQRSSEDEGVFGENGRVKLTKDSPAAPYGLFNIDGKTSSRDGLMLDSLRQVDIESSVVARSYFSQANVETLQVALRHGVFKASGQEEMIVGRQSDVELGIIMRSIYFAETRKTSMSVSQHVAVLNLSVLGYCIPRVLREARGYLIYRSSIQSLPAPLARGTIASMKGSRQIVGGRL